MKKETPLPPKRLNAAERRAAYKRLVDFVNKKKDRECAILGAMGFSTNYILSKTGLETGGRVQYRLRKAGIVRAEFRNGQSPFARIVLRNAHDQIDAELESHLLQKIPTLYEIAEMGRKSRR